jgi:hypothetical protein
MQAYNDDDGPLTSVPQPARSAVAMITRLRLMIQ